MEKATFSERLNLILKEKNIRQVDLCKETGIGKSAMSQYLHGSFEPKQQKLYALATALNVSEAWLMGYDVPKERQSISFADNLEAARNIHSEIREGSFSSFHFEVPDDSMEAVHIPKGAIVLVEKRYTFSSGQIVHISQKDQAPCLRTLYKEEDFFVLLAANPGYPPIVCKSSQLSDSDLKINGVVTRITIQL